MGRREIASRPKPLVGFFLKSGESALLVGSSFRKIVRDSQRTQANDLFKITSAFSEDQG